MHCSFARGAQQAVDEEKPGKVGSVLKMHNKVAPEKFFKGIPEVRQGLSYSQLMTEEECLSRFYVHVLIAT